MLDTIFDKMYQIKQANKMFI